MLGGIVQALHGLAALDSLSGVEVLISADEEVGSTRRGRSSRSGPLACGAVLVLEPSADGGLLKTGRKGVGTFDVTVLGRAAHAGLEPEKGINALIEASHQVLAISEFGRVDVGTTVTPTVAIAGTADNTVPAEARLEGRRAGRVGRREGSGRVADGVAPAGRPRRDDHGQRRHRTPADARVGLGRRSCRSPSWSSPASPGVAVGGGSDGNFTAALGIPTLDGLGAVGGGAHADTEHLLVASMPERARLVAGLVAHLTA